jgi:hypothetical protein
MGMLTLPHNVNSERMAKRRNDPDYLRAPAAEPGCGDLCFAWEGGVDALLDVLDRASITVIAGPLRQSGGRNGGLETGVSVYVPDPDQNLLGFMSYDAPDLDRY